MGRRAFAREPGSAGSVSCSRGTLCVRCVRCVRCAGAALSFPVLFSLSRALLCVAPSSSAVEGGARLRTRARSSPQTCRKASHAAGLGSGCGGRKPAKDNVTPVLPPSSVTGVPMLGRFPISPAARRGHVTKLCRVGCRRALCDFGVTPREGGVALLVSPILSARWERAAVTTGCAGPRSHRDGFLKNAWRNCSARLPVPRSIIPRTSSKTGTASQGNSSNSVNVSNQPQRLNRLRSCQAAVLHCRVSIFPPSSLHS